MVGATMCQKVPNGDTNIASTCARATDTIGGTIGIEACCEGPGGVSRGDGSACLGAEEAVFERYVSETVGGAM